VWDIVVKKFTFAISSPDEFLFLLIELLTCGTVPNKFVHTESTNTFKSRFDKFWCNQEIIYH